MSSCLGKQRKNGAEGAGVWVFWPLRTNSLGVLIQFSFIFEVREQAGPESLHSS